MFTTTVTWKKDSVRTEEQLSAMDAYTQSLLEGLSPEDKNKFSRDFSADYDENLVVLRIWPTQEAAKAWVDYVLANHPDVISAVDGVA